MKLGLSQLANFTALRRFVSTLCAVAFLSVGFAHLAHSTDLGSAAATIEVTGISGASDNAGNADPTKKSSPLEHCHGCMMVAIETTDLPVLYVQPAASIPQTALQPLRAISKRADSPPPRA